MLGRALECAAALALVLVVSAAYVYVRSEQRLSRQHAGRSQPIPIPSDRQSLERGRHLAVHVALCTWCHGDDLAGKTTADDPWVGRLHASNLTSGAGGIADWDDLDLVRAIRQGLRPDGRSLLLMPSAYLAALTDSDLAAVIAWLRSAAPVDAVRPETKAGPLTRLALVAGLAPELVAAEATAARAGHRAPYPESDPGAYLVEVGACRVCHHDDLSGGLHPLALPDEPPPPDLRSLAGWSGDDFRRAMRTGVTPDGRSLSPEYMPWPWYAGMTDAELDAIWRYLEAPQP